MGLSILLPAAAVITTAILVLMTEAHPAVKTASAVVCIGSFFLARIFPSMWWSAGPLQAGLSIVNILYVKFERYIG